MDVVIERGAARCPRCVAVADYSFTECGGESLRYEVRCQRCGEVYREESGTAASSTSHGTGLESSEVVPVPDSDGCLLGIAHDGRVDVEATG